MRAQRALLRSVETSWPDKQKGAVWMLAGEGRSPSPVWHAQAIGMLLELGFLPTAECVREHVDVIERRLQPMNCFDPAGGPERHPWILRTRHVAWLLACLAEMPRMQVTSAEHEKLRRELQRALTQHDRLVERAGKYLLGIGGGDANDPALWIGRDDDDDAGPRFGPSARRT